jgi:hypothetical protein
MEIDISMSILKTNETNNFGHRPDFFQVWNSKSSLKIGQLRFLGIKYGEKFAGGFRGSIFLILYRHTKNVSNSMFLVQ